MKKLKFAIIGAGSMGEIYANILKSHPLTDLIAVCSNKTIKTNKFAKKYLCKSYAMNQYSRMFAENNSLDAVIIASPEWVRLKPIQEAIKHNLNILCEKPVATSIEQAIKIKNLIKEHKSIFLPSHSLRFNNNYTVVKNQIDAKKIGKIRFISSKRCGNSTIAKRVSGKIPFSYWLTPHEIDLIRWYSKSEIASVFAKRNINAPLARNYLSCNFTLKNGIDVHHLVTWSNPEVSSISNQSSFEIFGTEGIISVDDNPNKTILFEANGKVKGLDTNYSSIFMGNEYGYFNNLISHFIECINKTSIPRVNFNDSYKVVEVCEAIERSIHLNKEIFLNK